MAGNGQYIDGMGTSFRNEIFVRAAAASEPITELVGPKLPPRYRKKVSAAEYRLFLECEGDDPRRVEDVAAERKMRSKRIWRQLVSIRRRLERKLMEAMPNRAALLIDYGRELREISRQFRLAQMFLTDVRRKLPKLKLPDEVKTWLTAECCLELGHVHRDRGIDLGAAFECYRESEKNYQQLEKDVAARWSDEEITAGWIVAVQNRLNLNRIETIYHPEQRDSFLKAANQGCQQLLDELSHAPTNSPRYRERRAETWRFFGRNLMILGEMHAGKRLIDQAYDAEEGAPGDHVGRLLYHADVRIAMGELDAAEADLKQAEPLVEQLHKERSLHAIFLSRGWCNLFRVQGKKEELRERSRDAIKSAKRLGLRNEEARLKQLAGIGV